MISDYIVNKIDEALQLEWIKVHYQPVIRSLTGELCGFESLARWEDPQLGRLAPDKFIGALEDCKQIYKLDCYMVDKVCRDIHDRFDAGLEMVPVSINFSRLDFLICDMLDIVEKAVEKYDIPRDYIHIEITESMVVSDGELMRRIIDRFRDKGYGIWMDDFGSGYSSLNLLKDFSFDVLKMDMKFLSSFNVKSKSIMRSVVNMAKDIGIMTLAEGVETIEEADFLKEIGCGRLQGYYFGKPEPLDVVFEHLKEKGIKTEGRRWHHFYDIAGFNVRATDTPLEILEYDGADFKTLYMNDAYKLQIFDNLPDLEEADRRIYRAGSPLVPKYHEFAAAMSKSKKPETFYYTGNSNYLCFSGREIAEQDGHCLYKGSILNITIDRNQVKRDDMEIKLRELNHLFAVVLLFNPEENFVTPLIGKFKLYRGPERVDMKTSTMMMANTVIHPGDRERYLQFMDSQTFIDRIQMTGTGIIEDAFRFKNDDGNFWWALVSLMMLSGPSGNEFMYCVKPLMKDSSTTILDYGANAVSSSSDYDEYSLLWYNFVWNSTVKFYWKDKDRRYRGVSKAFLDYFGLESDADIIGKTGEEMKWHMNERFYVEEEDGIIRYGNYVHNSHCQCLIEGVIHNTVSSKLPVYKNGEIVGLMGYIIDVDEERERVGAESTEETNFDPVTGVMNAGMFYYTFLEYIAKRNDFGRKFGVILLKNTKHARIVESYGRSFADSVLQSMADSILGVVKTSSAVARTKESYFAVMKFTDSIEELEELAEKLKEKVEEVITVEGKSVTIKIATSVRFCDEYEGVEEKMYENALDELRRL